MKRIKLLTLGIALSTLAAFSGAHKAQAQPQACTLLCIQGYHCCVSHDGSQSCIPESQPCTG
jgi:hypothetical protein